MIRIDRQRHLFQEQFLFEKPNPEMALNVDSCLISSFFHHFPFFLCVFHLRHLLWRWRWSQYFYSISVLVPSFFLFITYSCSARETIPILIIFLIKNLLIKSLNRICSIQFLCNVSHYIKSCIYIFFLILYILYTYRNSKYRSSVKRKEFEKGHSKRIISKKSSILTTFPIGFRYYSFIHHFKSYKVYSKYPDFLLDRYYVGSQIRDEQ